jgi:hypothetical protein
MKLTHEAQGTFAIAPTPFHDDGRVDESSIDRMTDFYGAAGCSGITVLGIMGEAPKLDHQEAIAVCRRTPFGDMWNMDSSAPRHDRTWGFKREVQRMLQTQPSRNVSSRARGGCP